NVFRASYRASVIYAEATGEHAVRAVCDELDADGGVSTDLTRQQRLDPAIDVGRDSCPLVAMQRWYHNEYSRSALRCRQCPNPDAICLRPVPEPSAWSSMQHSNAIGCDIVPGRALISGDEGELPVANSHPASHSLRRVSTNVRHGHAWRYSYGVAF